MKKSSSYCYLIHFESPPRGKQRHYLSYTANLSQCWSDHQAGHGSDLTKLAVKQEIQMILARVWPDGSKEFELELRKSGHTERICPACMINAVAEALTVGELGTKEVNVQIRDKAPEFTDYYGNDFCEQ